MGNRHEEWVAPLSKPIDPNAAQELTQRLNTMKESRKPKILVVGDDELLSEDVAYHLSVLAKRLSSEMLFLSSSITPSDEVTPPAIIALLQEWMGTRRHLAWVPAKGILEHALWYVTHHIHRVDFAVLVGENNQLLKKHLRMPVFSL